MSGNVPTANVKGNKRVWDESDERRRSKKWFTICAIVVGISWLLLIVWVLFFAEITKATVTGLQAGADLTVVLAPVLAAAAGVERLLETVFNTLEGAWHTMVAYLGYGLRWLKSAEKEVDEAREWLANTSAVYNGTLATYNVKMKELLTSMTGTADPRNPLAGLTDTAKQEMDRLSAEAVEKSNAAKNLLDEAQKRLGDAEDKLAGLTSSDQYRSTKSAASIVLGLMVGVIVAAVGQIQMFALLGVTAIGPRFDVLITGFVIGSGSYPVHSLVGILQQGKDTLDSVKGFFNRSASQGQTTEQRFMIEQPSNLPGERPRVQPEAVISTTTSHTTESTPNP